MTLVMARDLKTLRMVARGSAPHIRDFLVPYNSSNDLPTSAGWRGVSQPERGPRASASVEYDSRRVKPGCLFVAMRGETSDGNRFIDQAIQAGAVAVVTDSATENAARRSGVGVVPHGRRALARVSANFYRRPAERIAITGITGTNGKSTTAFLMEVDSDRCGAQERTDRDD